MSSRPGSTPLLSLPLASVIGPTPVRLRVASVPGALPGAPPVQPAAVPASSTAANAVHARDARLLNLIACSPSYARGGRPPAAWVPGAGTDAVAPVMRSVAR